jgi:hypothetical protein
MISLRRSSKAEWLPAQRGKLDSGIAVKSRACLQRSKLPILPVKTEAEAVSQEISNMKVDPKELLKTKRRKCDNLWYADNYLKINGLSKNSINSLTQSKIRRDSRLAKTLKALKIPTSPTTYRKHTACIFDLHGFPRDGDKSMKSIDMQQRRD